MTLPIERARTRRPVTWVTIIGALLLPVVVGAILVAAFYDPAERLDNVTAAIVNDDEPVTIDDQTVPQDGLSSGALRAPELETTSRTPTRFTRWLCRKTF